MEFAILIYLGVATFFAAIIIRNVGMLGGVDEVIALFEDVGDYDKDGNPPPTISRNVMIWSLVFAAVFWPVVVIVAIMQLRKK